MLISFFIGRCSVGGERLLPRADGDGLSSLAEKPCLIFSFQLVMWIHALISTVCCLVLTPGATQTLPQSVNLTDNQVKHSAIDIEQPNSAVQHHSTTFLPFTLKRKHVEHAVISAGHRNIHTTTLNDANLVSMLAPACFI